MLHQVGVGSFGPVFRAHDPVQDRPVAVKAFGGDFTLDQVEALADALEQLVEHPVEHPVLVQPVAAGIEGHLPYLVEEFVVAESMDVALREYGPAPLADALTRIAQLAAALDMAAAAGLHHGAMHPRDVLVSAGATRLTGLGLAPVMARIGGGVPVRRPYAAPEGAARFDLAADIFALAAIAFELLYGRRIAGTGRTAVAGTPALPGVDHAALVEVMAAALAEDPAQRPSSALAFAAALQEAVLDAAATPTPGGPIRRRARGQAIPLPLDQPLPLDDAADAGDMPLFLQSAGDVVARDADLQRPARFPDEPASPAASERAGEPGMVIDAMPRGDALDGPLDVDAMVERFSDIDVPPPTRERTDVGSLADLDLDLHDEDASAPAFDDEVAPASIPATDAVASGGGVEPTVPAQPAYEPFQSLRDVRAPRARWPLALAMLVLGLGVGFGGGYVVRDRAERAGGAERADRARDAAGSQDFTESAVPLTPGAAGPSVGTGAPGAPVPSATPAAPVDGAVLVRSDPPGARVTVSGEPRGVTPVAVRDVPFGAHTVAVTLPGYEPGQQRVSLSRERPSRSLDFTLRRSVEEYVGSLQIESRPTGARVFVDGREAGIAPVVMPRLTVGSHVVRIEMDGYRPWSTSVQVIAGERARVAASLDR